MKKSKMAFLIVGVIILIAIVFVIWWFEFNPIHPGEVLVCVGEGDLVFDETTGQSFGECCEDLVEIGQISYDESKICEEIFMEVGYGAICSDCGNGICEEWENQCNCEKDCPLTCYDECNLARASCLEESNYNESWGICEDNHLLCRSSCFQESLAKN